MVLMLLYETIHIQLAADQLVQEFLGIFIFEYLYGKIELTFHPRGSRR